MNIFLFCSSRRARQNKKKIVEIGAVDREIIANNVFVLFDQFRLHRVMNRFVRNTSCYQKSSILQKKETPDLFQDADL